MLVDTAVGFGNAEIAKRAARRSRVALSDAVGVFGREEDAWGAARMTFEWCAGLPPDDAFATRRRELNFGDRLPGRLASGSSGNFILVGSE